ncbi:B12-binding domain-containing radical SAM protein [Candidatus Desantisbacteria bacterium]|nr:B12-binding domain-containing radical SAM protein [Candidatus Desantisbacteria bacterium]
MSNKKILLTILPVFWPKMPTLGISYLQVYLKDKSINADILDLNNTFFNLSGEDIKKSWFISCNTFLEENILSLIKNEHSDKFYESINKMLQYDIVGFSCFKSNFKTTIEVIKMLKFRKNSIKIILGGPEIARQYFKSGKRISNEIKEIADFIVVGEGEKSVYDYVEERIEKGTVRVFSQLENLDNIPYPEFTETNLNNYQKTSAIPLLFTRGCIRKCGFCSEKLLFKGFRSRSVVSVINEIKYHRENKDIKYFIFFDSMLNADVNKLEELCDEIINNFGSINWEAQIAVRNDMDINLFKKMKKSGCYNLFIGLESGSENTLKRMNKGFTAFDAENFFKKLIDADLFFGISIIVGYPGETEEDFWDSLNFVIQRKNIIPKIEQINPFTYYDGTDTDVSFDYKTNPESMKRMGIFVEQIKKHSFKYTNAFLGNLIEKAGT